MAVLDANKKHTLARCTMARGTIQEYHSRLFRLVRETQKGEAAGARGVENFKDHPNEGDCVWGDLVYYREVKDGKRLEKGKVAKDVRAGDIVQFRDAKFEGKKAGGGSYFHWAPSHAALVLEVKKGGKELVLLHQNWAKSPVRSDFFTLDDLQTGWFRIYRPLPK